MIPHRLEPGTPSFSPVVPAGWVGHGAIPAPVEQRYVTIPRRQEH